jgi:hypothetical protein
LPAGDPTVPTIPLETCSSGFASITTPIISPAFDQFIDARTSVSAASNSSATLESLIRTSAEVSAPSSGQLGRSMLVPSDSSTTGSSSRRPSIHSYDEGATLTLSDRRASFQALEDPVETVLQDIAARSLEQGPIVSSCTHDKHPNHPSDASPLEQSQPPVRCRVAKCGHLSKSKKAEM